jgi:hypothetical protein
VASIITELRRLADEIAEMRRRAKTSAEAAALSDISTQLHTLAQRLEDIQFRLDDDPRTLIDPRR